MFGSLRVRLPLVFLAGIILAGVITTLVSVRLFQDFAHNQALTKLKREAHGIAVLYARAVDRSYGNQKDERAPSTFAAESLQLATGDKIYFVGPGLFPGQGFVGLNHLPANTVDWLSGKSVTFEFTPPDAKRTYLAVSNPILNGTSPKDQTTIGAIVVATPKTNIGHAVYGLIERLALATLFGLLAAGAMAWYLSRRIVRPVLQLSDAVDAVAAGRYDVIVPPNAPGELGHLSTRVGEMAHRLAEVEEMERNFLMSVSHELRTPLTAIR